MVSMMDACDHASFARAESADPVHTKRRRRVWSADRQLMDHFPPGSVANAPSQMDARLDSHSPR
jgi:hypothetical protein